jgi:internalin A
MNVIAFYPGDDTSVCMEKTSEQTGIEEALRRIAKAKAERAEVLNLSKLGLTSLPREIGLLTSLQRLYLHDNQLTTLPPEIGSLKQLTQLDLSNNRLAELPQEIGLLTELNGLSLDGNQLNTLPPEIGSLAKLQVLSLDGNQLTTLPREIGSLTALGMLDLSDNNLTTLTPEIGSLTALKELLLDNNQLTKLPPEIRKLEGSLQRLYLHNNPKLGLSAEVLGSHWSDDPGGDNSAKPAAILAAYFGSRTSKAQPLNEVKLLFVGHGRVGKTSLVKALRGVAHDDGEGETQGIERHKIPLKHGKSQYTGHAWDFGGQEFLHHTHQFFFSTRSIYAIVVMGRVGGVDAEAEYWLRLVRTYGQGSPVVLVKNQIEAHHFEIDEFNLRERYPEIKAVVETDCDPRYGIKKLHDTLAGLAGEVEGVKQKIDPRWAKVRTRLEEMEASFIAFEGYQQICTEEEVVEQNEQEVLATILNCLGIALNYREDPRLRDTSVLKPQWLVDGIYGVLRWMQKEKTQGIVRKDDLAKALPKKLYPVEMHGYLLELMVKFELCFELDGAEGRYLVPGMLSPNQPVELKRFMGKEARRVQFRYGELRPPGLMPQFIVRSHTLSEAQTRWLRGVVLKRGNAEVLVRVDAAQLVTDVYALGEVEDRVWLTEYVHAEMQQINAKLSVKTYVESEAEPGVWVEWETLRADTLADVPNRTETREGGGTVSVTPASMLSEVESPQATTASSKNSGDKPLGLFVCYAHKNERLVKEILPSLRILTGRAYIRAWRDTDLIPGEDWDDTIKQRLLQSQVVLYMVSRDFLGSTYIREQERPLARQLESEGKAIIIPIMLLDCTFDDETEEERRFEMLPCKDKTLHSYKPRDKGWTLVELGIMKAVTNWRRIGGMKKGGIERSDN